VREVHGETAGAACTALLAVDLIDTAEPLVIVNGDQLIEVDLAAVVDEFADARSTADMVIFPDVHPRWSFVKAMRMETSSTAAEKRPISNLATAGFYYFGSGAAFVEAAEAMILKDASVNGCSTSARLQRTHPAQLPERRASHRQSQLRFARYSAGRAGLREPPRGTRPIVRT